MEHHMSTTKKTITLPKRTPAKKAYKPVIKAAAKQAKALKPAKPVVATNPARIPGVLPTVGKTTKVPVPEGMKLPTAAAKASKADKPAKVATPKTDKKPTAKERILELVRRPEGVNEAEVCTALGWKAAAVTMRRAFDGAGLKTTRTKGTDGKFRYFVA
jgi:Protein of unknown function (DUF3489)